MEMGIRMGMRMKEILDMIRGMARIYIGGPSIHLYSVLTNT